MFSPFFYDSPHIILVSLSIYLTTYNITHIMPETLFTHKGGIMHTIGIINHIIYMKRFQTLIHLLHLIVGRIAH